jgi:hypothetical protein
MTSPPQHPAMFWRVAWKESGSVHKTEDHDTEQAAHTHQEQLRIRPNVSMVLAYPIPLIEDTRERA